jgi:uncharacterized protein YhfF
LIATFWRNFCEGIGVVASIPARTVFGDTSELQTQLCDLVLSGQKRATASLAEWYGEGRDPLPEAGDLSIVLDGHGIPRGVIEITHVRVGPFSSVDEAFAADEGEDDCSLGYWIGEHQRYFTSEQHKDGRLFAENDMVVFERFKIDLARVCHWLDACKHRTAPGWVFK